jgi:hypothetical protein
MLLNAGARQEKLVSMQDREIAELKKMVKMLKDDSKLEQLRCELQAKIDKVTEALETSREEYAEVKKVHRKLEVDYLEALEQNQVRETQFKETIEEKKSYIEQLETRMARMMLQKSQMIVRHKEALTLQQAKQQKLEEQLAALRIDLEEERQSCKRQLRELDLDWQHKHHEMENKLEAQIKEHKNEYAQARWSAKLSPHECAQWALACDPRCTSARGSRIRFLLVLISLFVGTSRCLLRR